MRTFDGIFIHTQAPLESTSDADATDTFPDAHKPSLLPSREEGNTFLVQIRVELGGLDDSVCVPVYLGEPSGSAGAGEPPAVALDVARGLLHADAQVAVEVDVREVPRSLKGILPFGKRKNHVNITMDATCTLSLFLVIFPIWTPQLAYFQAGGVQGRASKH